jgi:hypothetical protein
VARIATAKLHWNVPVSEFRVAAISILDIAKKNQRDGGPPINDLIQRCFTPDDIAKLHALRDALQSFSSKISTANFELVWLAITSVLRSVSHVGTAQWQYLLPNRTKAKSLDAFVAFEAKVRQMCEDMTYMQALGGKSKSSILRWDSRAMNTAIEPGSVDLVITSPPYPNNFDYADATRLEMTFWGEISGWGDLKEAVRKYIVRSCSQHAAGDKLQLDTLLGNEVLLPIQEQITAACRELETVRLTKGGKKTYHTMIAAYFIDLGNIFRNLRLLCKDGAKLCYVVGDSAPYGVYIPAELWLGELALAAGFKEYRFEKLRDRNVKWKNRKHDVPLHEGRLWIKG